MIKVNVGIPESFKVGWYPPKKKLGRVTLKGHSQLWDRDDLDTTFASFGKRLPQPEIKCTHQILLEIRFNLA